MKFINIIGKAEPYLFFTILLLLFSYFSVYLCTLYSDVSFDNQILLSHLFFQDKGLLPYRDIFYPYGLIFYFKNISVFWSLAYSLIAVLYLSSTFFIFKAKWGRIAGYISVAAIYAFIQINMDISNFVRYGTLFTFAIVLSYFASKSKISKRTSFSFGIASGIAFSLVTDQGLYSIFLFLLFSIVLLFYKGSLKNFFSAMLSILFFFTIGLVIGMLPLIFFLVKQDIVIEFLNHLGNLADFPYYAKTPFIPNSVSFNNLFTFGALFSGLFILSYRHIYKKRKLAFISLVQLSLVFSLIILEQKSLLRSIDLQVTFFGFGIYLTYLYEIRSFIEAKVGRSFSYVLYFILSISLLAMPIKPFDLLKSVYEYDNNLNPVAALEKFQNKNSLCLKHNVSKLTQKDSSLLKMASYIKKNRVRDESVFSYLSDPLFYVFMDQKPPYFFTIFESTPIYAQEKNIEYLKKHDVKYVIYNVDAQIIGDGVPFYARTPELLKFVINNYKPVKKIDNYILLERSVDYDMFEISKTDEFSEFTNEFLNINLESIPRSEGLHKSFNGGIRGYRSIFEGDLKSVQEYLVRDSINSSDIVLGFVSTKSSTHEYLNVQILTLDSKETELKFRGCKVGKLCVVNVENIPLFYKNRLISEINVQDYQGVVKIFKKDSEDNLW